MSIHRDIMEYSLRGTDPRDDGIHRAFRRAALTNMDRVIPHISSQELEIKRYSAENKKWARRKERWNDWKKNKTHETTIK